MTKSEQALEIILSTTHTSSTEIVDLINAGGRILRTPIYAFRNDPPITRVLKDGIALCSDALVMGAKQFKIEGIAKAGMEQLALQDNKNCIEVMAGAVLPHGCDSVIMYEEIQIENNIAKLLLSRIAPEPFQHYANEGSYHFKGEVLLDVGIVLRPPHIGILASQGISKVEVSSLPRMTLITSGDEVVEMGQGPDPHQVRGSNRHALTELLRTAGISSIKHLHINDELQQTQEVLAHELQQCDYLILCGGVSAGKYDFIPTALKEIGCNKLFHQVKQHPGKPLWFGKFNHTMIFGLPGNPVSSLVCMRKYVIPSLHMNLTGVQYEPQTIRIKLSHEIMPHQECTTFIPASIRLSDRGEAMVIPCHISNSNDYAALATSTGFIEIFPGKEMIKYGELINYYPWDASPFSEASFS